MRTPFKLTAVAVAAVLMLTGCEKPRPEVTLFSGAKSVHVAAGCWSTDAAKACDTSGLGSTTTSFTVLQGTPLGISVDSDIAEAGWTPVLVLNGQTQALTKGLLHRRYWKMQYPETAGSSLMGQPIELQIVTATSDGKGVRGAWLFSLNGSESLDNA